MRRSESDESSFDDDLENITRSGITSTSFPRNSTSDNTKMSPHNSGRNCNVKQEDPKLVREITELSTTKKLLGNGKSTSEIGQENAINDTAAQRRGVEFNRSQSIPFRKLVKLSKMLQPGESSSSDEEPYTSMPISPNYTRQTPRDLEQTSLSAYDLVTRIQSDRNRMDTDDEQEIVPMHLLSEIVSPDVLSQVKSQLKGARNNMEDRLSKSTPVQSSPAKLWEMRKRMHKYKSLLNRSQATKIKAEWKVRECIASLPDGETINTFYLALVRRGMLREIDALFNMSKDTRRAEFKEFDKNYIGEDFKSALIIAIDTMNESMMRKLLEHGVDLGLSIFNAIDADFIEGLKLILAYDACTNVKIELKNYHFHIGMTPMLMAAHGNNYRMLSMLHKYGHRLTEVKDWIDGLQEAWESANERRMIFLARAQPAYITLHHEVNHTNPMTYCLKEVRKLRQFAKEEREFSDFYKELRSNYEKYMCSLLDFVCSSDELSDLFQFERPAPPVKKNDQVVTFIEGAKQKRWKYMRSFELLERAGQEQLIRFVTHQQSQLALSYMCYHSLPLLRNRLIAHAVGLLFPILSIFYIFIPNSPLGELLLQPAVSFYCHMMSDIVFALLLLSQILLREEEFDKLGQPVTTLEWLIFLWIVGKWVQEIQECLNRGFEAYIRDIWNYADLILLTLFSASMVIRIYDAVLHSETEHVSRNQWGPLEPRLIGEGMQAVGYIFLFLRLLGLMRADRYLGPLQISLGKMLHDIVRFLCLFALVLGAFAFGLNDLYWYYGTAEGSRFICGSSGNESMNPADSCRTKEIAFTSILGSIRDLFWALFNLFDLDKMSLNGKHAYTEYMGRWLVATYHVVAIIVMLNMLIAMMSNTYDDTSQDEAIAWKFHRTSVWIRFIRREVVRPPPMNLFPNPWRIKDQLCRLLNFYMLCCHRDGGLTSKANNHMRRRTPRNQNKRTLSDHKKSKDGQQEHIIDVVDSTRQDEIASSTPDLGSGSTNLRMDRDQQNNDQRLNPVAVSSVKAAARMNIRKKYSKDVLKRLVFRYKIKNLTKK